MDKMLQEFLEFAKEKYGVNVTVSESDSPDSFKSVFGDIGIEYYNERKGCCYTATLSAEIRKAAFQIKWKS